MKHTYHCKPALPPACDSASVLADNIVEMYNTVFTVGVFPQWRHEENWNTISWGYREHLTLTETERRKRRGAEFVFVGGGLGLMYLSRPKFLPGMIPQPAGRRVLTSSPQELAPTGVWSSAVINEPHLELISLSQTFVAFKWNSGFRFLIEEIEYWIRSAVKQVKPCCYVADDKRISACFPVQKRSIILVFLCILTF